MPPKSHTLLGGILTPMRFLKYYVILVFAYINGFVKHIKITDFKDTESYDVACRKPGYGNFRNGIILFHIIPSLNQAAAPLYTFILTPSLNITVYSPA